jgi:hypothetical protein
MGLWRVALDHELKLRGLEVTQTPNVVSDVPAEGRDAIVTDLCERIKTLEGELKAVKMRMGKKTPPVAAE